MLFSTVAYVVVVVVEEVFIRGECCGMTNYQARCFFLISTTRTLQWTLHWKYYFDGKNEKWNVLWTARVSHNEKLKGVSVARMIKMSDTIK